MLEPELVRGSSTRTGADRGLAGRLQHRATAQLVRVPDARRICRGQRLWKRRWLRHLGKRYAFPTFPQPRRRRPYFNRRSGTQNPGSFVMTGPKTGGRSRLLRQIPSIGPIRAVLLIALMQTPHRFRTKRQLWAYCGLALKTSTSGEYQIVEGRLKRSKKFLAIRGLNTNHNHDLKNIFKGAATRAAAVDGPFQEFYAGLVARGMK